MKFRPPPTVHFKFSDATMQAMSKQDAKVVGA